MDTKEKQQTVYQQVLRGIGLIFLAVIIGFIGRVKIAYDMRTSPIIHPELYRRQSYTPKTEDYKDNIKILDSFF